MHDDDHTHPGADRAGAAIRDSLPGPDDQATDRIAARIARGTRPARVRRRPRRRLPMLRPALAAGAVASAATVALLAPGGDGPDQAASGFMAGLGPEPAAAVVLHAAGRTVAELPWRPLGAGEVHYARTREHGGIDAAARESERWFSADGTVAVRERVDPSTVAGGEDFYVPAESCRDVQSLASPQPLAGTIDTIPTGSAIPTCWSARPSGNAVVLRNATGDVVDSPPSGATVYLPTWMSSTDGRELRFGDEVFESDEPQPVPGGMALAVPGPGEPATRATFHPHAMPTSTTWVRVTAEPIELFTATRSTGVASSTYTVMPSWMDAFGVEELQDLPSSRDALEARIASAVDELLSPRVEARGTGPAPPRQLALQRQDTMVVVTTDLLATGPVSPDVRRALFDVLATMEGFGGDARVVEDATLPDGGPAIGIEYPFATAPGMPSGDDGVLLLVDPHTAQLVARTMTLGDVQVVTTWSSERRDAGSVPATSR